MKGSVKMAKQYGITEMAELVGQNKENIRRFIKRKDLKELNTDRPHANSPKYYGSDVLEAIKREYESDNTTKDEKHHSSTTEAHESTTEAPQGATVNNEVVQLLRDQVARLERDKVELKEHQSKLTQMLEQQQHLTLIAQKQAETLSIELNEVIEAEETKEPLLSRLFKRNK